MISADAEGTFLLKWNDEKAPAQFISTQPMVALIIHIPRKAMDLHSKYPFASLGFALHLLIPNFTLSC